MKHTQNMNVKLKMYIQLAIVTIVYWTAEYFVKSAVVFVRHNDFLLQNVGKYVSQDIVLILSITIGLIVSKKIYDKKETGTKIPFYFPPVVIAILLYSTLGLNVIYVNSYIKETFAQSGIVVMLSSAFYMGLQGLVEEVFTRGLILRHWLSQTLHSDKFKNTMISVIVVSLIFGLSHLQNIFYGMPRSLAYIQVVSATLSGLTFGFIYVLSNRSIVTVGIFHYFIDFTSGFNLQPPPELSNSFLVQLFLLGTVPWAIACYLLYRTLKKQRYNI